MADERLRDFPWQISYGPNDDRLESFYLPALSRSIRFDRATGFFSSAALAVAAAGIARLIQAGGRMRLLCGAQLATGAAHTTLTPFWSGRLGKTELTARQVSARGGYLKCTMLGERVEISGQAAFYLSGEISVP